MAAIGAQQTLMLVLVAFRFCPLRTLIEFSFNSSVGWFQDLCALPVSDIRAPRNDGQIGTTVCRAGALHDIERGDRTPQAF